MLNHYHIPLTLDVIYEWFLDLLFLNIHIPFRKSRDLARSIIGPDLLFIVLNLTKSCQMKRLAGREGGGGEALFEKGPCTYDVGKIFGISNPRLVICICTT